MVKFFLNRPVFIIVISIMMVLLGLVSLKNLSIEQFPTITPVQVLVQTVIPGASAETLANSVAAPLEEAINGIEDMIYMHTQTSSTGSLRLIVSFKIGTDPNIALINTQNRVNLALSSLPADVQKQGVVVLNQYPNVLLFIALQAKDGTLSEIALTNFANTTITTSLNRVFGVNSATVLNARNYSMRLWLHPDKIAQLGLSIPDVLQAVEEQNENHPFGVLGGDPVIKPNVLAVPVVTQGRLKTPEEFENIILRANPDGSMVLLKDVCRVELGAYYYDLIGRLDGKPGAFIAIYPDPNVNAIEVAQRVNKRMEELSIFFPEGVTYTIPYDITNYIKYSIARLGVTLLEAAFLVCLVILLFLHNFRASLIPIIAMLISIIGTFTFMYFLGFSINTLSLFGLVLCVGIVVDDAIVVVENIERNMRVQKLNPRAAALQAMKEVSGPVIATSCVLAAVFIPVSFVGGIPGEFYKQFAITIAVSVLISGFVALTLSPVLSVALLQKGLKQSWFSIQFNEWFDRWRERYVAGARWLLDHSRYAILIFCCMLGAIGYLSYEVPVGFVPSEDQGLLLISSELPDGASLTRVQKVSEKVQEVVSANPNIESILSFSGYSLIESIPKMNMGIYFVSLKKWEKRKSNAFEVIEQLNQEFTKIPEANITAFNPPDIPGIGVVGGFDFWIVNDGEADYSILNDTVDKIVAKAKQRPEFQILLSSIHCNDLQLYVDIDVIQARSLGVRLDTIYKSLQTLLGSVYINQFNKFGHVYRVVAQADPKYRDEISDMGDIYVRSSTTHEMVPLKSLIRIKFDKGPNLYQRFNGAPAGLISVIPAIADSKKIIETMEEIAKEFLPPSMYYSWGGIAYQEKETGGVSVLALFASLVFAFLILAALYERWTLPVSILLTFPFAVFGAFLAVWLTRSTANIYFQIGLITLMGLAAKNAILIVEFAKEKRKAGLEIKEAALEAARLRFRAILMTSLTMIIGALPLVITSGAGAASRKSVGTGVIGGMILATFLAVFFVPIFYCWMERLSEKLRKRETQELPEE